ncbi:MAG: protein kinase [Candidatus Eiseniibacteriota bacterium]|nr:MAG: protein kinase [Candidatus Eisenbacteria bacterium]
MSQRKVLHYEIHEKLGEGGMGVIYRARDTRLRRDVAIKFLPRNIARSEEDKERFKTEATAAAALNHPNIATVYAIEEVEGEIFIVMEYIDGKELKELIGAGALTLDKTVSIVESVADALKKAHSKHIVHRDIKSSNIMITSDGKPKIMDFGLAKVRGSREITREGTTLGTEAYMSPEQASRRQVDHRSDIWSLGVVFYEMLTGQLPFKSDYDAATIYAILNMHPTEPSQLDRSIPSGLDAIVMRMLDKNLDKRYASAQEVMEDLRDFREGLESSRREADRKVMAVLPFHNISPEGEGDYFSDGLTEELIMNLSRLKELRIVSRTTSMQYKATSKSIKTIGRELDARYILEGSVRRFRDDLRITAQLIDVRSDTPLWAETFNGTLADVFDIQERVSKQIVDALMVKLTPSEKVGLTKRSTVNTEAFDCYQKARELLYQLNMNKLKQAIQLFEKAIGLDPRYANAYAGMAEAYGTLYQTFERKDVWLEKSLEAGLKALMYDPSLSQAYSALSLCYFNKGSLDEAQEASKKAIELDPSDHVAYWILGRIDYMTDRDAEAIGLFKKAIELNPDFYSAYADLGTSYQRLGQMDKFDEIRRVSLELYPRYLEKHPDDGRAHMFFAIHLVQEGRFYEARLQAEKALAINPTDPLMLYNTACFYARIGDKEHAIQSLKDAIAAGFANYDWFKRDPDLESIRSEPEYIKLVEQH